MKMSWSILYTNRPIIATLAAVTACLSASLYIRSAVQYEGQTKGLALAAARVKPKILTGSSSSSEDNPYPSDVFPGGRHVDTPYGIVKVFEWGPEEGEKVLLMHGIGTPCVALGDMAKHLVSKRYRVMLFGECRILVHVPDLHIQTSSAEATPTPQQTSPTMTGYTHLKYYAFLPLPLYHGPAMKHSTF